MVTFCVRARSLRDIHYIHAKITVKLERDTYLSLDADLHDNRTAEVYEPWCHESVYLTERREETREG